MPITPADIKSILSEKDSERVALVCPKHQYTGSKMPPSSHGCKECWQVYYIYDLASTPPSLRKERLDELEYVVRKAAKMQQKGTWDFVPQERPTIEFTKDGFDDEVNDYKESK